jgi:hypothetical protein
MSRVRVTIDRLALKGFERGREKAFAEGLQAELARSLGDPAARADLAQSRRMAVLRVGPLPHEPGAAGMRTLAGGISTAIAGAVKR